MLIGTTYAIDDPEIELNQAKPLKTGWQEWYPYQYLKNRTISTSLTGLDIRLVNALAKEIHQKIEYKRISWPETLEGLKTGTIDFAYDAAYSKEREAYAYYSKPYRTEEDSLFVLRRKSKLYTFETVEEFLNYVKKKRFRFGANRGVLYTNSEINDFINDPANAEYILPIEDKLDALSKLLNNEIDGFLIDRIAGSALILESKYGFLVSEHNLNVKAPIYLIFSKKTVPVETVLAFNRAIDKLSMDANYQKIITWYLYPVILLRTVHENWFKMLDILGTVFFSISGVLIARSLNVSIFAAFVYAVLPSIGGGIVRDVIFSQRPVDVLTTPLYIAIVYSTVIIGFAISKFLDRTEKHPIHNRLKPFYKKISSHLSFVLMICDALGLAAFTVTGVIVSLVAKAEPLWLWGPFFSFLTGAAGTIIRDILSKNRKLADIEGEIYSEIAILWGLFLSIGLLFNSNNISPDFIQNLVLITVAGAFFTRLLVYYFKVPNVYFK